MRGANPFKHRKSGPTLVDMKKSNELQQGQGFMPIVDNPITRSWLYMYILSEDKVYLTRTKMYVGCYAYI